MFEDEDLSYFDLAYVFHEFALVNGENAEEVKLKSPFQISIRKFERKGTEITLDYLYYDYDDGAGSQFSGLQIDQAYKSDYYMTFITSFR